MGYSDIAELQFDPDFARRTQAAYAVETLSDTEAIDPASWQSFHSWDMAAQPGFGDAYASAVAGSVDRPGNDPSVISDSQILSAIQSLLPQAEVATPMEEQQSEESDPEPEDAA